MSRIALRLSIFLMSFLLCGFADPTPVAFNAIDANSATGKAIKIRGLLAKPDGAGPFPAIVLLHTCGGVRRNLSHEWPAFYTGHGYVSLTVDSFGSRGVGPCPNEFTHPGSGHPLTPYKAIAADAQGALAYLESLPFVKKGEIALAGYSLGGIVIHMAILPAYATEKPARAFKAAISLYGNCAIRGTLSMPAMKRAPLPLLEIIGEKDERILRNCRKHLPRGPETQLHVLPGAYHAFDISFFRTLRHGFAGAPMKYSEAATNTARRLIRRFLAEHLAK